MFPNSKSSETSATDGNTADETASSDGSVDYGNMIGQLRFKGAIEIFRSSSADQTVLVRQLGEDANVVTSFKLNTYCLGTEGNCHE